MNSISQSLRIESLSLGYTVPPGSAVRALAVGHGLLAEHYPRSDRLRLDDVLNDVEWALLDDPSAWEAFASGLTALALQDFGPAEVQTTQRWVGLLWRYFTPSTIGETSMSVEDSDDFQPPVDLVLPFMSEATITVDDPVDHLVRLQDVEQLVDGAELLLMEHLRRASSLMLASLDERANSEKKQVLAQWMNDVRASDLPMYQQAQLIGEFAARVLDVEPAEVKECAWNLCVGGLATMAGAHPGDQVLNDRFRQIAETLPTLPKLRYTNNPLVALAQCREAMRVKGYPQVASALYLTAARQVATSLRQDAKECQVALNNLLDQIHRGRTAGDEIPTRQMAEVLGPAVEVWTSRNGGSMSTHWRAFLRDAGF